METKNYITQQRTNTIKLQVPDFGQAHTECCVPKFVCELSIFITLNTDRSVTVQSKDKLF